VTYVHAYVLRVRERAVGSRGQYQITGRQMRFVGRDTGMPLVDRVVRHVGRTSPPVDCAARNHAASHNKPSHAPLPCAAATRILRPFPRGRSTGNSNERSSYESHMAAVPRVRDDGSVRQPSDQSPVGHEHRVLALDVNPAAGHVVLEFGDNEPRAIGAPAVANSRRHGNQGDLRARRIDPPFDVLAAAPCAVGSLS